MSFLFSPIYFFLIFLERLPPEDATVASSPPPPSLEATTMGSPAPLEEEESKGAISFSSAFWL